LIIYLYFQVSPQNLTKEIQRGIQNSDENPKQLSEINKDDKSVSLSSSDEKPSDNSKIESNSENESKKKEMEEVEKTKEIKPEDPTLNPDLEMAQPKQDK